MNPGRALRDLAVHKLSGQCILPADHGSGREPLVRYRLPRKEPGLNAERNIEDMIEPSETHSESSLAVRPIFHAILVVVLLTACRDREPVPATFQTADSAGVTIVESSQPLWESGDGWTLSAEPEVVIGKMEGDERYLLDRVAGARRLSDGRIAILDVGSHRVRVYDPAGEHMMDLGDEGDGPSEFRNPQFLGLVSDTLVVYEYFPGSLTWFSPDGRFLRTSNVFDPTDGEIPRAMMFGYLEDRIGLGIRIVGDRDRPHVPVRLGSPPGPERLCVCR